MVHEVKIVENKVEPAAKTLVQDYTEALQKELLKQISKRANSAEAEANRIIDKLIQEMEVNSRKILLKLIGFNNHWGNDWEVDHCNGRAGQTAVGDAMKQVFIQKTKDFIDEHADKIFSLEKKELDQIIKTLKSEFIANVKRYSQDEIKDAANKFAIEQVNKIVEDAKSSNILGVAVRLQEANTPSKQ